MALITLMTDFGLKDGNVGVMKGVIARIAPQVQVVDISHLIGPQNIAEASLILARSAPFFPAETIHVVVVDPGVGTARRPMAARLGEQFYVGPDNGTLTMLFERLERQGELGFFYHLNRPEYWLPEVSHVFHGRDIFAPAAAYLASGTPLESLGSRFKEPVRLKLAKPTRVANGLRGEVIHIDHFGNIAANIRVEDLADLRPGARRITVFLGDIAIQGMVKTFGERPPGELIALFGSTGNLIVAVVDGNAAELLHVGLGEQVEAVIESAGQV